MQTVKLWHQALSYAVCEVLMWKGCAAPVRLGEVSPRILYNPAPGRVDPHFPCLLTQTGDTHRSLCLWGIWSSPWCSHSESVIQVCFVFSFYHHFSSSSARSIPDKTFPSATPANWSRTLEQSADLLCTPLPDSFLLLYAKLYGFLFHYTPSNTAWSVAVADFQGQLCWCVGKLAVVKDFLFFFSVSFEISMRWTNCSLSVCFMSCGSSLGLTKVQISAECDHWGIIFFEECN